MFLPIVSDNEKTLSFRIVNPFFLLKRHIVQLFILAPSKASTLVLTFIPDDGKRYSSRRLVNTKKSTTM
jgi:hypothetical protein